ncbi:hypothetical protein, partial [Pseudomonas sp. SIMBA_067]|uniref:hypothetical protein n=1 Tax=Pseudomonas sp. SIMBA_067 TaxID=3085807 RepID=UPI00397E2471
YGELNDLLAMVHRLGEVSNGEFFFDIGAPDHVAVATKLGKVEKYLDYSRSLHLVEGGEPIVRWAVPRNWKPVPEVVTREMREAG